MVLVAMTMGKVEAQLSTNPGESCPPKSGDTYYIGHLGGSNAFLTAWIGTVVLFYVCVCMMMIMCVSKCTLPPVMTCPSGGLCVCMGVSLSSSFMSELWVHSFHVCLFMSHDDHNDDGCAHRERVRETPLSTTFSFSFSFVVSFGGRMRRIVSAHEYTETYTDNETSEHTTKQNKYTRKE